MNRSAREGKSVKRFEQFNGLDTALYKNYLYLFTYSKGPATHNDFVNDIVNDARADAIFATLKAIVDDEKSTMKSRRYRYVWHGLYTADHSTQ